MKQLQELFGHERLYCPKELTAALETAILKKSDHYASCIQLLLDKGADPCGVNGTGTPFLHMAADAGCHVTVKLLLKAKCDPNQCKDDGSTPLHRAVWNDHRVIIQALIEAGADLEVRDMQGRTPLILSSQRNRTEVLQMLLQSDAEASARDIKGRTALYWAARYNNIAVATALLELEADIDCRDRQDTTALMIAAERGYTELVEQLLDHDASFNLRNDLGMSALMLAASNRHIDCVRLLVDFGAEVNIRDSNGVSPLLFVISDSDTVYHLLEAGADPDTETHGFLSATLIAVCEKCVTSLRILIQVNCNFLKGMSHNGKRPLHDAMLRGHFECTQVLFIATIAVGGNLWWLREHLFDETYNRGVRPDSLVHKTRNWLRQELQGQECVPPLFNLCRGIIRKIMSSILFEENLECLPLPSALQASLKLPELDEFS